MTRQQLKSTSQCPGRSLVTEHRWKFLLGILVITAKMKLVSSEGGEGVVPPRHFYEDEPPDDLFNLLVNSDGSWMDYDLGGTAGEDPEELDTLPPPMKMKMKKHLGSVAAASGLRLPLLEELRRSSSGGGRVGPVYSFKRGGPLSLQRFFGSRRTLGGSRQKKDHLDAKISHDEEDRSDENEIFYDRPLSPQSLYREEEESLTSPLRGKRFMGSLARGGWFPREFRGFVSTPQWDKRHVGAFARLGWMPHSKFTRGAEQNFKRNLGSLRKNQILSYRKDNKDN